MFTKTTIMTQISLLFPSNRLFMISMSAKTGSRKANRMTKISTGPNMAISCMIHECVVNMCIDKGCLLVTVVCQITNTHIIKYTKFGANTSIKLTAELY